MKVTIITFCLIWAVFANPISFHAVLESSELNANTTESMSMSQSSESNTTMLQRTEENSSQSSQSSESDSESLESESEDKTSEESNSQSEEDSKTDSMAETRDNSMGSEENVRKSWVRLFARVNKVLNAEDNSSIEVKGQSNTVQDPSNLPLVANLTDSSDTTSDSADTSLITGVMAATSDSSESISSESNETSEASDSSDASNSTEESNASDSTEMKQIKAKDCVNATQSCESEEYFFQDIGDDVHNSVDNLMVPDEDEREFRLRR